LFQSRVRAGGRVEIFVAPVYDRRLNEWPMHMAPSGPAAACPDTVAAHRAALHDRPDGKESMELQHINVKLLLAKPEEVDLEPLVRIFHGWIQDQAWGELLLDVADYRHVHESPGVILIGYEGNYSLDNRDNRLGVRYNRKAPLEGGNQDRLRQAAGAALLVCERLEADPRLQGKLRFNGREIEISINDRGLAPNTPATREAVKLTLLPFLDELFAGSGYSLAFHEDPRSPLEARVEASRPFSAAELSKNLSAPRPTVEDSLLG
jgi:hypothetical protein